MECFLLAAAVDVAPVRQKVRPVVVELLNPLFPSRRIAVS